MAWVKRGRRSAHMYRSVRQGGTVQSVYVGPAGDPHTARLLALWADDDRRRREQKRAVAEQRRNTLAAALTGVDGLAAGADLLAVAGGLLVLLGYHRPNRGGWRTMRSGGLLAKLRGDVQKLSDAVREREAAARRGPLLKLTANPADPEMVALFAAARKGDRDALARLPGYIRDRGFTDRLGDLGGLATAALVARAGGDDPVLTAGVRAKADALWAELAGPDPTALELLLVRRCVNGWLGVHVAEIELDRATDRQEREAWDHQLSRSQRRLAAAVRELAVVRRLEAPAAFRRVMACEPTDERVPCRLTTSTVASDPNEHEPTPTPP